MKIIKNENLNLISAKELYAQLGIQKAFSTWIKQNIERAELQDKKDFITLREESTGGRPSTEYHLSRDAALTVIMMSGGKLANSLRNKVIELYNQHDTGLAFNAHQIEALMDLSKAMTLISIQKEVEKKHFAIYNDKYTWYEHRAALLGYRTRDIIEAMQKVNRKHHSIKASLIQLDANELIRTGVIDFMVALGKSEEYAINAGNLCKTMAQKMKLGNIIWDDTIENPLKIKQSEVIDCKNRYNNVQKMIV